MPVTLEDILIALEEKYGPGFSLESMEDLTQTVYEALSRPIDVHASIVCLETIKPLT